MLVKVLDEYRVKILVEDGDVAIYNLPFEKLNYDDPYSKSFIYKLIEKTYRETGINFRDSRVIIEVIPGASRSYYVLLTKDCSQDGEAIEFDKLERSEPEAYIYKMSRGGDVIRFFSFLVNYEPENSELYYYDDSYYAVLIFSPYVIKKEQFRLCLNSLDEFAHRCKFRFENMGILAERGELLIAPNAHEIIR